MKRILVADDHDAVRSGLRAVLEARPGWEVVAEAHDGREALAAGRFYGWVLEVDQCRRQKCQKREANADDPQAH